MCVQDTVLLSPLMDLGITGAHHTLALVSYEKGSYSSVDEMEDT